MKRVNKGQNGTADDTSRNDTAVPETSLEPSRSARRQYTRPTVQKRKSLRYATLISGGGSGGSAPTVN